MRINPWPVTCRAAFVGSQSLRKLELDARREIGVLVKEPKLVKSITEVFEAGRKQARQEAKREQKDADEKEQAVAATA